MKGLLIVFVLNSFFLRSSLLLVYLGYIEKASPTLLSFFLGNSGMLSGLFFYRIATKEVVSLKKLKHVSMLNILISLFWYGTFLSTIFYINLIIGGIIIALLFNLMVIPLATTFVLFQSVECETSFKELYPKSR